MTTLVVIQTCYCDNTLSNFTTFMISSMVVITSVLVVMMPGDITYNYENILAVETLVKL